jgi:2-deoxy-D-gluconate 3-dehydrogenase
MNDERNNLFSLSGKVALVTGASRGLGRAIAIGLSNAGAIVICCASKEGGTSETEQMINQAGGKSYGLAADLSDEKAVAKTL